jgi:hypothetical protein
MDDLVTDGITETLKEGQSCSTRIGFPYISQEPIEEYDKSEKLYCKEFPWLYPGGVGDINSMHNEAIDLDQWIQHLLHYQDGRFARDKMWCFFALNYSQQKKCDETRGLLPIPELGKPRSSYHINEFTIVIQEYFQIRVKCWLATVGKTIFKITHHWL